jgi:hypothetical protein
MRRRIRPRIDKGDPLVIFVRSAVVAMGVMTMMMWIAVGISVDLLPIQRNPMRRHPGLLQRNLAFDPYLARLIFRPGERLHESKQKLPRLLTQRRNVGFLRKSISLNLTQMKRRQSVKMIRKARRMLMRMMNSMKMRKIQKTSGMKMIQMMRHLVK